MAKRFTDTDKWDKPWYRKLPSKYKLLWQYITDKCTQIGVWHVDLETAGYYIGEIYDIEESKQMLSKQLMDVAEGTKWFLKDFIPFQYGVLNPEKNHFHRNIVRDLKQHNIKHREGCGTPLGRVSTLPQDKKGKDRRPLSSLFDFDKIWQMYPKRRIGEKKAREHFNDTVKTDADYLDIQKALLNYTESREFKQGYVKYAKNWFAEWREWLNYTEDKNVTAPGRQGLPAGPEAASGKYENITNR